MIHLSPQDIKKRPLAFFLPSLRGGGAERVILNLVVELAKRGFMVELILTHKAGDFLSHVPKSVSIVDLSATRAIRCLGPLIRHIRHRPPSILISSLPHLNVIALVALFISWAKTKSVVIEHNTFSEAAKHNKTKKSKLLLTLMRLTYPRADGIIAVSNGVADDLSYLLAIPREKFTVIYNPVVSEELLKQARAPLSDPWFDHNSPPVILAIGRLTYAKNFRLLVNAFARVGPHIDSRLVILGDGPDRANLSTLIQALGLQETVALYGFVDNPYKYLTHCSIFVLSSRWEGLPTVLIEALACNARVISTDCKSGPEEILEGGKWGQLVPMDSIDALASAILDELRNPSTPIPCKAWARFTAPAAVDEYLSLFSSLINDAS